MCPAYEQTSVFSTIIPTLSPKCKAHLREIDKRRAKKRPPARCTNAPRQTARRFTNAPRCASVGGDAHAVERSGTSTLGVHRPARFTNAPLAFLRRGGRPCPPNTAQRCHSEPVRRLAWESVPRARRRGTPLAADCQASATLLNLKSSVGERQPRHFLGLELIRSTTISTDS